MDELRFSLIVIGVVIVGGIYIVGKMIERSRTVRVIMPRAEPEITTTPVSTPDTEPDFKMQFDDDTELQFQPVVSPPPVVTQTKIKSPIAAPRAPESEQPPLHPAPRDPELIVSLTLMARNQQFCGTELQKVFDTAGLKLAEFDIYHFRDADAENDTRAVFSVANIVKPGTFNAATLHEITTPGLALFMQIPGPMTASEAFDAMLEKAQFIAQRLHGIVGDEQRTPLSLQRIREIRERVLNYDFAHVVQSGVSDMQSMKRPQ